MGKRPRPRVDRRPVRQPFILHLERRLLMCARHLDLGADEGIGYYPAAHQSSAHAAGAPGALGAGGIVAAGAPLTAIPALSSLPSATAKLFLDFDGDTMNRWGAYTPGTTPAYDTDGEAGTFGEAELAAIREIWSRVAEKYSPFNIDVTTVDPGNVNDYQTLRVVFGGTGSWFASGAGGVAYIGGFTNSASNTAFVFTGNLGDVPRVASEAAAHESGHGFGLQHQGLWTGTTLTAEYHPGVDGAAPIMGSSYSSPRGLWWYGTPSNSSTARQDDLAVISSTGTNRFGYRPDDVGNTAAAARALVVNGTGVGASGVIEQMSDVDVFWFHHGGGPLRLSVTPVTGGMLDARVELRDAWGSLSASSDIGLAETLNANIPGGTYYLAVASHGEYGDLGQYAVTGTIVPMPQNVAAPTGLVAWTVSNRQIATAWSDNAVNETAYEVQRSSDGGASWQPVATLAPGSTNYADGGLAGGTSYGYRVLARAQGTSSVSNVSWAMTRPDAPAAVTAVAASATQINVAWSDVAGEAGYRVERWTDASGWVAVGSVGPDVTSFQSSGLAGGTVYYHRVVAISYVGETASHVVAAATPQAPLATATFAGNDYATRGAWQGVRGSEGYVIPGLAQTLPPSVAFTVRDATTQSWGATSDARALQTPGSLQTRWASAWRGAGPISFDFNFTDGATHRLAMYLIDRQWLGAALHVQVIDTGSGKVLAQQPVSGFEEGRYLSWDVKGAVRVRVTSIGTGEATVAGFFVDRPPAAAQAGAVAPAAPAPAAASPRAPLDGLFSYTQVLDWYRQQVRLRRGAWLTP